MFSEIGKLHAKKIIQSGSVSKVCKVLRKIGGPAQPLPKLLPYKVLANNRTSICSSIALLYLLISKHTCFDILTRIFGYIKYLYGPKHNLYCYFEPNLLIHLPFDSPLSYKTPFSTSLLIMLHCQYKKLADKKSKQTNKTKKAVISNYE